MLLAWLTGDTRREMSAGFSQSGACVSPSLARRTRWMFRMGESTGLTSSKVSSSGKTLNQRSPRGDRDPKFDWKK